MSHPSLIFEEIGIHLAESAMFFTGCFLPMIIRSEGQEEIVSVSDFKNYFCPFWRCESVQFYPHHTLVDELCDVSLESGDAFVFLPTEVRMSDRDYPTHISHDTTRLFSRWFVFWYFNSTYGISSFSFQTFIEKSDTIWLTATLVTICHLDSAWSTVYIAREMSIIETLGIVSLRNCPLYESLLTEWVSLLYEFHYLLTDFLSFSCSSTLEHGVCWTTKRRCIRRHMKSDFTETSEKMCRNLTRGSRLNSSRAKLLCEAIAHEIMIRECRKFDPRREEIFEYLFWSVAPIRERRMEMEVGFHKEKIMI